MATISNTLYASILSRINPDPYASLDELLGDFNIARVDGEGELSEKQLQMLASLAKQSRDEQMAYSSGLLGIFPAEGKAEGGIAKDFHGESLYLINLNLVYVDSAGKLCPCNGYNIAREQWQQAEMAAALEESVIGTPLASAASPFPLGSFSASSGESDDLTQPGAGGAGQVPAFDLDGQLLSGSTSPLLPGSPGSLDLSGSAGLSPSFFTHSVLPTPLFPSIELPSLPPGGGELPAEPERSGGAKRQREDVEQEEEKRSVRRRSSTPHREILEATRAIQADVAELKTQLAELKDQLREFSQLLQDQPVFRPRLFRPLPVHASSPGGRNTPDAAPLATALPPPPGSPKFSKF